MDTKPTITLTNVVITALMEIDYNAMRRRSLDDLKAAPGTSVEERGLLALYGRLSLPASAPD